MHHFFVSPEQIGEKTIQITGSDVNHIKNVLRMKVGEEIRVRTGEDEKDYRCRIDALDEDVVEATILWVEEASTELSSQIVLYQGLPKSDKMELIIQKVVELGAYRIVPVAMKRCVVKLERSKQAKKIARWQAISESAAKQSRRMIVPKIDEVMTFDQALADAQSLDHVLVPYELAKDMGRTREILSSIKPGESVGIFIGPEGGIEDTEVEKALTMGAQPITLGKRILRTETAGMAVVASLMIALEESQE